VRERTYTEQAEQVFYEGEEALDDGNYPYAMQLFRRVRDSYELSTWATLAELRIGDVFFEQGDYRQAAEVFRTFIQLHPNHGAVGYARFRIGMAYYEDMPSDFFLLPPAYERELGSTRLAEQTLADFLRRHGEETEQPMAGYVVEARAAYQEALDRLAGYEFYLAEFYLERERPVAAANHLRTLLQDFPDSSLAPDSLFLLARCYVELADVVSALEAIQTLESRFPAHRLTERARGWMERNALDFSLIPEPS
jgi:outer membrane protein assembly factor BamD